MRGESYQRSLLAIPSFSTRMSLSSKVVLVTGGSSGIGAEAALLASERGASVVITSHEESDLQRVYSNLQTSGDGQQHSYFVANLRDRHEISALFDHINKTYGRLDCVFSNAGLPSHGPTVENAVDENVDALIDVNVKAAVEILRNSLPMFRSNNGGSIVYSSSIMSAFPLCENARGIESSLIYASTKSFLDTLCRFSSSAYSAENIRSYCVNPYVVDTPIFDVCGKLGLYQPEIRHSGEREGETEGEGERESQGESSVAAVFAKGFNPSGQAVTAREVATVALDMLDGSSQYRSGDCVAVDSGPTTVHMAEHYAKMYGERE